MTIWSFWTIQCPNIRTCRKPPLKTGTRGLSCYFLKYLRKKNKTFGSRSMRYRKWKRSAWRWSQLVSQRKCWFLPIEKSLNLGMLLSLRAFVYLVLDIVPQRRLEHRCSSRAWVTARRGPRTTRKKNRVNTQTRSSPAGWPGAVQTAGPVCRPRRWRMHSTAQDARSTDRSSGADTNVFTRSAPASTGSRAEPRFLSLFRCRCSSSDPSIGD